MNSFISMIIGAAILVFLSFSFPTHTFLYKKGQIDAISGDVKYHLVDKPDGSRVWELKID